MFAIDPVSRLQCSAEGLCPLVPCLLIDNQMPSSPRYALSRCGSLPSESIQVITPPNKKTAHEGAAYSFGFYGRPNGADALAWKG